MVLYDTHLIVCRVTPCHVTQYVMVLHGLGVILVLLSLTCVTGPVPPGNLSRLLAISLFTL